MSAQTGNQRTTTFVVLPHRARIVRGRGQLCRTAALVVALPVLYAAYRWIRRRQLIAKLASARIEVDELVKLFSTNEPPVVFDIRSQEKRKLDTFVIPGAQFAVERQLDDIVATDPRDQKHVIYCSCLNEISAAWMAKQLNEAGFSDVLPLLDGMEAWRDSGKLVDARSTTSRPKPSSVRAAPRPFEARGADGASAPFCRPFNLAMNTEGAVQCFRLKKFRLKKYKDSKTWLPMRRFRHCRRAGIRCTPRSLPRRWTGSAASAKSAAGSPASCCSRSATPAPACS
jgi:rhodanese-related sulfurtransferase